MNITWIVARTEYLTEGIVTSAVKAVSNITATEVVAETLTAILRVVEGIQKLGTKLRAECFRPNAWRLSAEQPLSADVSTRRGAFANDWRKCFINGSKAWPWLCGRDSLREECAATWIEKGLPQSLLR